MGFVNPPLGFRVNYHENTMKGRTKRVKAPGKMRKVLADNVNRLMAHYYRRSTNQAKDLAAAADVSLSTVQRIVAGASGATIDSKEAVAGVFHLSAYQILVPDIDPTNPPVVEGAVQAEKKILRAIGRNRALATQE